MGGRTQRLAHKSQGMGSLISGYPSFPSCHSHSRLDHCTLLLFFLIAVSFSGSSRARTTSVTSFLYGSSEGTNSGYAVGPQYTSVE